MTKTTLYPTTSPKNKPGWWERKTKSRHCNTIYSLIKTKTLATTCLCSFYEQSLQSLSALLWWGELQVQLLFTSQDLQEVFLPWSRTKQKQRQMLLFLGYLSGQKCIQSSSFVILRRFRNILSSWSQKQTLKLWLDDVKRQQLSNRNLRQELKKPGLPFGPSKTRKWA